MTHTGRCYCGELSYEFDDPIHSQILCHCRECRYLSGGAANTSVIISEKTFRFTKGNPKIFKRDDLKKARVRYLCGTGGTHIRVESPPRPGMLVLKIGTLDDHSWFSPQSAIYCIDKQPYHLIPEEIPSFERVPEAKP
ncbi:MAG: GFA family protein [Paracoccaceae bacterium]